MNNDQMEAVGGRYAKWLKWLGIALIVLGFLAIVFPLATTIATKIFIGWLLVGPQVFGLLSPSLSHIGPPLTLCTALILFGAEIICLFKFAFRKKSAQELLQ